MNSCKLMVYFFFFPGNSVFLILQLNYLYSYIEKFIKLLILLYGPYYSKLSKYNVGQNQSKDILSTPSSVPTMREGSRPKWQWQGAKMHNLEFVGTLIQHVKIWSYKGNYTAKIKLWHCEMEKIFPSSCFASPFGAIF